MMYVIKSTTEEDLYWNNEWGWLDIEDADVFTEKEKHDFQLPVGGVFVPAPENAGKKVVVVRVQGGVVQNIDVPPGVLVKVCDYDVDGTEEENLKEDEFGDKYVEGIWT